MLDSWLLPAQFAKPLIAYLPILFPGLVALYASVHAGNDWYAAESLRARINLAVLFALISVMPAGMYVHGGHLLISGALVLGSAVLGYVVACDLGRRGKGDVRAQRKGLGGSHGAGREQAHLHLGSGRH